MKIVGLALATTGLAYAVKNSCIRNIVQTGIK